MNSSVVLFYLVCFWSCIACVWPPTRGKNNSYVDTVLRHNANIGGAFGASVGAGMGAAIGSLVGSETGATFGGAMGGGVGGAVGGFVTGGPVGAVSGFLGGCVGGASGASLGHIKAAKTGKGVFGKMASARLGGILGGATGGYFGIGGAESSKYVPPNLRGAWTLAGLIV